MELYDALDYEVIPSVLSNKFELHKIQTVRDLIDLQDDLLASKGFGKKCMDSLRNYINGILPDYSEQFRFMREFEWEDSIETPSIIINKLRVMGIRTSQELISRKNEIKAQKAFGYTSEVALRQLISEVIANKNIKVSDNVQCEQCIPFYENIRMVLRKALNSFKSKELIAKIFEYQIKDRKYTLEEVGLLFSITRERVRQQKQLILPRIKQHIMLVQKDGGMTKENRKKLFEIQKIVCDRMVVTEQNLIEILDDVIGEGSATDGVVSDVIACLLSFGGDFILHSNRIEEIKLIIGDGSQSKLVEKIIDAASKYLREVVLPQNVLEAKIAILKSMKPSRTDERLVGSVIKSIPQFVEHENTVRIAFYELNNYESEFRRVLYEKGQPTHFGEVRKEICKRLTEYGLGIPGTAISSKIRRSNQDLVPIGKKGLWGLKEWGTQSTVVREQILHVLHKKGEPVKKTDLVNKILKNGEYPKQTVMIILSSMRGKDVLQLDDDSVILKDWKRIYGNRIKEKKTRIKSVTIDMCRTVTEILVEPLSTPEFLNRYMKETGEEIAYQTFYQRIDKLPCVEKHGEGKLLRWRRVEKYIAADVASRETKFDRITGLAKKIVGEKGEIDSQSLLKELNVIEQIEPVFMYKVLSENAEFVSRKSESDGRLKIISLYSGKEGVQHKVSAQMELTELQIIIKNLIKKGEGPVIEFKSTLQWDLRENRQNKGLVHEVLKTIAAFSNSKGGNLLIGVEDDGNVIGLKHDYSLISKGVPRDQFALRIENHIKNAFGLAIMALVEIQVEEISMEEVCYIRVKPSKKPVLFSDKNKNGQIEEFFYVRGSNSTQRLIQPREILDYMATHFG